MAHNTLGIYICILHKKTFSFCFFSSGYVWVGVWNLKLALTVGCSFYAKGCWWTCSKLSKSCVKVDLPSAQCHFTCNILLCPHFNCFLFDHLFIYTKRMCSGAFVGGSRNRWSVCANDSPASYFSTYPVPLLVCHKFFLHFGILTQVFVFQIDC